MQQDITAVLLPSAQIDFFAGDDGTAQTAENIGEDWRFARVDVSIARAGIDAAIEKYTSVQSPAVVVIETDDISEAFTAKLEQLAGVCTAGTDAVVIGPTNDVHLYRSLVGMGVRDYLVRPVSADDLVSVLARALVEKHGLAGSRLVSVIGAKGGMGVTTVAQILAWDIAQHTGEKTILGDVGGSRSSIGIAFGMEAAATLAEAIRIGESGSEDDIKRIVLPVTDNLSLLFFGGDPLLADPPQVDGVEKLVTRLMQKSPVIVMDLSDASPSVAKRLLALSAHVVVVSNATLPAVRNTRMLLNEIKHMRNTLDEVDIVINMQSLSAGDEVPANDLKTVLEAEPAARIAFQPKPFIGGEAGGKFADREKQSAEVFASLEKIAARAAGKPVVKEETTGALDGVFKLFKKTDKKEK